MFALLHLVLSRPWEPIELDRSPTVASSVTIVEPIPTLAEALKAAPADSARPETVAVRV
jgi:hypothetical protein